MGENEAKKQLKVLISADNKKRWDELVEITTLSGVQLMSQLIKSLHYVAWKELVKLGFVSNQKFIDLETGGKIIETKIKVRKCPSLQKKIC